MRWGILFRREVSLTFARIQDIHLTSNFVERWLGLAKVQVQTASGSSTAEMTIEGLPQFEAIRDFLYSRMRGARDRAAVAGPGDAAGEAAAGTLPELAEALREVAAEVRALRLALPAPADAEGGHA
jgi:putative membrane protein